jgi:glycine dehydrogenase
MGPIGVKTHLQPFLPTHPFFTVGGEHGIGPVASAPWGSASILTITWSYLMLMGDSGLSKATKIALLNANYMMERLKDHYPILFTNQNGKCAHEFIIDMRPLSETSSIEGIDVAKRLQDYGFHSPTMSFPVPNTLMVEPTESEPLVELDRFCDAMIQIRKEIQQVEDGVYPKDNNPLVNAPHTQQVVSADKWDRPYSRSIGAYPVPNLRRDKFWPTVSRIDDAYGDRNLVCTCPPIESYE